MHGGGGGGVIVGFYSIWNVHVTSAYVIASTSHQEAFVSSSFMAAVAETKFTHFI